MIAVCAQSNIDDILGEEPISDNEPEPIPDLLKIDEKAFKDNKQAI